MLGGWALLMSVDKKVDVKGRELPSIYTLMATWQQQPTVRHTEVGDEIGGDGWVELKGEAGFRVFSLPLQVRGGSGADDEVGGELGGRRAE